jgi:hypothetical protein
MVLRRCVLSPYGFLFPSRTSPTATVQREDAGAEHEGFGLVGADDDTQGAQRDTAANDRALQQRRGAHEG